MKLVTPRYINDLINRLGKLDYKEEEKKVFYYKSFNKKYVVCDNTDCQCFIEEFMFIQSVHEYLDTNMSLESIHRADFIRKIQRNMGDKILPKLKSEEDFKRKNKFHEMEGN